MLAFKLERKICAISPQKAYSTLLCYFYMHLCLQQHSFFCFVFKLLVHYLH